MSDLSFPNCSAVQKYLFIDSCKSIRIFSLDSLHRVHNAIYAPRGLEIYIKMVLRKVDNRIRVLIENGVQKKHRSMFVIVGDKGKDQVSYSVAFHSFTWRNFCSFRKLTVCQLYIHKLNLTFHQSQLYLQTQLMH